MPRNLKTPSHVGDLLVDGADDFGLGEAQHHLRNLDAELLQVLADLARLVGVQAASPP